MYVFSLFFFFERGEMECGNVGGGGGEEKEEEENGTGRGVQQVLRKKRGSTVPGTWCTTVPTWY